MKRATSKFLRASDLKGKEIDVTIDRVESEEFEQEGGKRVFRVPDGLQPPLPADQLRLVVTVLAAEPGLAPVWNWQHNGVPACYGDPRC